MCFYISLTLLLALSIGGYVYMNDPAPLQWNIKIDKLVMPMNSDLYHLGSEWGQQPFFAQAIIIPLPMYRLEEHETKEPI